MSLLPVLAAVAGGLAAWLLLAAVTRFVELRRLRVRLGLRDNTSTVVTGARALSEPVRPALIACAVVLAVAAALPGLRLAMEVSAVAIAATVGLWMLHRRAGAVGRRQRLVATLPAFVEVVALCVRGGLSLETALREAARTDRSPTADYFRELLKDAEAGSDIAAVLKQGGSSAQTVELRSVCRTLSAALLLGVPTAEALAELSSYASRRRRQSMEERIRSLPVRLTLVAMLLLLPPLVVLAVLPNVAAFLQSPW